MQLGRWEPGWCESKYAQQSNMLMDVGMGVMPAFQLPQLDDALLESEAELNQCSSILENTRSVN